MTPLLANYKYEKMYTLKTDRSKLFNLTYPVGTNVSINSLVKTTNLLWFDLSTNPYCLVIINIYVGSVSKLLVNIN